MIEIRYRVRVEWTHQLDDLAVAERLAPFHLWQNSVIEERFRYDGKDALNLAFVRVAKLSSPFVFPDSPKFGGCRSWVDLPEPSAALTALKYWAKRSTARGNRRFALRCGIDMRPIQRTAAAEPNCASIRRNWRLRKRSKLAVTLSSNRWRGDLML